MIQSRKPGGKPFNVTLIKPETYIHSLALSEAAEYLHFMLIRCGYHSELSFNRIDEHSYNIIFCGHLLGRPDTTLIPRDSIIFNSEQLEDTHGWMFESGAYRTLIDELYVWDYSPLNLARIDHDKKDLIPFGYCQELNRRENHFGQSPYLLFYGAVTEDRREMLESIQKAGLPLKVLFGQYGKERDAVMFEASAVLNLHKTRQTQLFEPIRCFYPLINGVPVISETITSDPVVADFIDSMTFIDRGQLVDFLIMAYRDPEDFFAAAKRKAESFSLTNSVDKITAAVDRFLALNE